MERVQKLLSNYGYCSRRRAEELIQQGRVTVNARPITLGDQAEEGDIIRVDGKVVKKDPRVYLLFHKPYGCVTSLKDPHKKTIMEYIDIKERVFPVGRLDYDTTGLLILTNDGDFANKIMHPRYEIKKTYVATLDRPYDKKVIEQLKKGVDLKDGKTRPAQVKRISPKTIELTIHEGKNHIVKRMFKKLGYKVLKLRRTRIGKYYLGSLKPGQFIFVGK